jgi:hypothetical protein
LQLIPKSLKLGAACISKISVSLYGTIECKTPQNYGLKNLNLEDLKSYRTVVLLLVIFFFHLKNVYVKKSQITNFYNNKMKK